MAGDMPRTADRIDAVMVFAAGLGTRMRPLTLTLPKPLVEVGGKALIDHMLDRFAEIGVAKAVVNVHWLADRVEAHVRARKAPRVVMSDERALLLDQGGGIVKALPELGEAFYICNTDAARIEGARPALAGLAAAWDPAKMDILLLVATGATSVGVDWPGDFHMDAGGRLTKRGESEAADFVYAGVGIMKASLFAGETRAAFRLAPHFFDAAAKGRLYGHRLDGVWLHVGTPEAIGEADAAFSRAQG